ncbi:hypothetical protein PV325_004687 [Microctonus aethiopoides]|nr:hypothetical protein PV325_004687 [Microctonus aethiopoides]
MEPGEKRLQEIKRNKDREKLALMYSTTTSNRPSDCPSVSTYCDRTHAEDTNTIEDSNSGEKNKDRQIHHAVGGTVDLYSTQDLYEILVGLSRNMAPTYRE